MANTAQIVIDNITSKTSSLSNPSVIHNIFSQDSVLLIFTHGIGSNASAISVNGNNIPSVAVILGGASAGVVAWYMVNPPAGPITVQATSTGTCVMDVFGLRGVSKSAAPFFRTGSATAATVTASVPPNRTNNLLVSAFTGANLDSITVSGTGAEMSMLKNAAVGGVVQTNLAIGVVSSGLNSVSFLGGTGNVAQITIGLEPAYNPSIYHPVIQPRSINEIGFFSAPTIEQVYAFGTPPVSYYQNSFFQTVGRLTGGTPAPPPPIAVGGETLLMMGV